MSRLFVDKIAPNTTSGDVHIETSLIVSGNLNVTGTFDAHVADFKVNANSMVLGDAASDIVTINAATASIPNNLSFTTGSIAVGTTTLVAPSGVAKYVLVSDASSAGVSLNDTGGTQWDIYSADSRLHFFASTQGSGIAHRMVIQENGQVGIGTINPAAPSGMARYLTIEDSSSAGISVNDTGGTQWDIYSADSRLHFFAGSQGVGIAHRMVIQENGNVGIGTINPSMPLHIVNSAGGRMMLHRSAGDTSSQLGGIMFGANDGDTNLAMIAAYHDGATDAAYVSVETEAAGGSMAERMRITSAGNVGIGVTDPDELLEVAGDVKISGANKLYFYDSGDEHISAGAGGVLSIAAGTEVDITATTIDMNGNVDISGNALVSGEVQTANIGYTDGDNAMTIADGGAVTFAQAAVFSGGFSAGDANITNVGDIALDSISSDAGTTINVTLGTDAGDDFIVATDALVVEGDNKNIGVGTTTPTSNAGVSKFIEISDASSAGVVLHDTGGREWTIYNADGKLYHHSDSSGQVLTLWGSDVGINTATPGKTLDVNGDARIGDDLLLQSDAAVLSFGADDDVSLTHVADTGLLLNGTMKIQFNDASQFIQGSSATVLSIGATDEIDLTATTIDINGAADISGNLVVGGNLTINGTTTTVNSTVLTVEDPIITIGDAAGDIAADDNKDRGIEFKYHNGSSAKVGFFGFDDSTGKFTFIADATNSSEVFSGTVGPIDVGAISAASITTSGAATVGTDLAVGDDLTLGSDGAIVNFGANSKVTLTHSTDTNPTETSEGLILQTSSALDDHVAFPLVLTHLTSGDPDSSDGAGTPGLGVGLGFKVDSDAGSLQNAGAITVSTLDATSGSESYGMSFSLMKNGGSSDQPITFMSLDTDAGGGNQTELSVKFDGNNYFRTVVAADGATTLQTVDESSGADGHLTLDSCGNIEFNADAGNITFKDGSQTAMSIDMATTTRDAIFKDADGVEIFRIDGSADSILMASDKKIEFNDSTQFIHGSSATVLSIGATDEIDLTATAIDINGAVDVSGALTVHGVLDADAGVTIDNITIDGSEIDLSSGDLTIDVEGDIIIDANGGDVTFKDNATSKLSINMATSVTDGAGNPVNVVDLKELTGTASAAIRVLQADGITTAQSYDWNGIGGFGIKRPTIPVTTNLDLSNPLNAMGYMGAILLIQTSGTTYNITLPTTTDADVAKQLQGWNIRVMVLDADGGGSTDAAVKIIRGDTSGSDADVLFGNVYAAAEDAASDQITISSNEVTFASGCADGSYVDVVCVTGATGAGKSIFHATGFAAT
tara:strand:- start:1445 stop:5347 length:3903 start_codon:yes stop_codon:yes gene_type:complete